MRVLITGMLIYVPWLAAQTSVSAPPAAQTPGIMVRQPSKPGPAAAPPGKSTVPAPSPETPVVTLEGVCKTKTAAGECKTPVSRADMDSFVRAFAPQSPANARARLAVQYARSLAYASLAEQQGLDRNPALAQELELQLKMVRMRILATAYLQNVQKKTDVITGAEVQAYYDSHRELYEEAQVRRVSVPFAVPTADGHPLDHSAVKAVMATTREHAAAGEDLNDLQQQAYKELKVQATAPQVNPLLVRRSNLQGDEAKVMDLKDGELSEVLDLPGAFAFAQLVSRQAMPLESVRPEIEAALRRQRMQNALAKLGTRITAKFNLEYLDLPSQPELFGDSPVTPKVAIKSSARRRPGAGAGSHPLEPRK